MRSMYNQEPHCRLQHSFAAYKNVGVLQTAGCEHMQIEIDSGVELAL